MKLRRPLLRRCYLAGPAVIDRMKSASAKWAEALDRVSEVIFQAEQNDVLDFGCAGIPCAAKDGERNPATLGQRRCWTFKFCMRIDKWSGRGRLPGRQLVVGIKER